MNPETRNCQNCKKDFTIEPEDFDFYKKIDVPPPTFCSQCRFQRRIMFRNERIFYKRDCELCGKSVVSRFSLERGYHNYCQPCWWSDKWDGADYGVDYDPSRNFFKQFKELTKKVPYMSLITDYSTLVNSEYINHAGSCKNCYLVFNADYLENVSYCTLGDYIKDSMDLITVGESELCYELINCGKCFRAYFSEDCTDCTGIYFSKDCVGCSDCFGCVNLRKQKYCWFNEPVGKEEFERRLKEANLGSRQSIEEYARKANEFWLKFPNKSYHGLKNVNSSGDYIYECKNSHNMYQSRYCEDSRYCQFMTLPSVKDTYDLSEWGSGIELICDSITVGENSRNIQFCCATWSGASDCQYCLNIHSSQNMFGCVNMKKKQYCILNKQYSKEEYQTLRKKIIDDLERDPYVDSQGRIWKFGEFFPYDLTNFAYNESQAIQYFPLTKEEALAQGFSWQDPVTSPHQPTMKGPDIPDSIEDTQDSITNEVIECIGCQKVFRIIPIELALLRRFNFPVPNKCPDCRHMVRLQKLNPPQLWNRNCAKCQKNIETSFAPDRPEIVYCETCYQQETA